MKPKLLEGVILLSDAFFSPQLQEKIFTKLSEQKNKPGLYVVATPIGNIFDITLRALHILKNAKYIFAEDTRQSDKLLNFYDIHVPMIACHEFNEINATVTTKINNDDIYALISDAGTPMISDPGFRLVNWCVEHNINVCPVPGACAFVAALSAAGLPTDQFLFLGFLPNKPQARKRIIEKNKNISATLIVLESPKRILDTLNDLYEIFGDRYCCICRELTKIYEEFQRTKISQLIQYVSLNEPIGEFVIIIAGCNKIEMNEDIMFTELMQLMKQKSIKDATKEIAEKYDFSKKIIYKRALVMKAEHHE